MRVLALDPGEKVGWACADIDPTSGAWQNLTHGITELWQMAESIHAVADKYDLIIYENWLLYAAKAQEMVGSSFPSVQFIGAVKLSARLAGTRVITQSAQIKEHADKAMKVLMPDMYELVTRPVRHDDGHDQDAIRHLFYWTLTRTDLAKEVTDAATH
jgi:hypothetical protein